jgi:hypothetical protein
MIIRHDGDRQVCNGSLYTPASQSETSMSDSIPKISRLIQPVYHREHVGQSPVFVFVVCAGQEFCSNDRCSTDRIVGQKISELIRENRGSSAKETGPDRRVGQYLAHQALWRDLPKSMRKGSRPLKAIRVSIFSCFRSACNPWIIVSVLVRARQAFWAFFNMAAGKFKVVRIKPPKSTMHTKSISDMHLCQAHSPYGDGNTIRGRRSGSERRSSSGTSFRF